jgi:hypothetical protein
MNTKTVTVPDAKLRAVLAAIRNNGGFITRSTLVGKGWQVTYTVYR